MISVKFEGIEDALKVLEKYPINAHKVVDKAIRKAGREAVKEVRNSVPVQGWRRMAKGKLKSYKEGVSFFKFGLYAKDKNDFSFVKARWKNYGTLSNRDPNHQFSTKRKPKTAKWKGGIKPANFFEPAAERGFDKFSKRFIKELNKSAEDILLNKNSHATTTTTTIQ